MGIHQRIRGLHEWQIIEELRRQALCRQLVALLLEHMKHRGDNATI